MKELFGKRQETGNSLLKDIQHDEVNTFDKKIIAKELNIFYIFYIFYIFLYFFYFLYFLIISL